jgi:hypothetical protein
MYLIFIRITSHTQGRGNKINWALGLHENGEIALFSRKLKISHKKMITLPAKSARVSGKSSGLFSGYSC